jgi:hypothetical protein
VVKGAAWGAAHLVSALAIPPFPPTLGGHFFDWDDGTNFVTNPGFRSLHLAPRLEGAPRELALALERQAEALCRQCNAAEAQRPRQEATELRAVVPAAKPPVEIPGRDRETARP